MSAAVMSNYFFAPFGQGHATDSEARVQTWMLAQMAQYPPPPQPDHHHYNALYPASAGAQQQLVDPQDSLQYGSLNQPAFAKIEATSPNSGPSTDHSINHLAQELHHQAAFDEQHRQSTHNGSQQPLPAPLPQGLSPTAPRPAQTPAQHGASEQPQKSNRLRKACDSCSIRKVKCDESGPPCRACASLDIPCTFERPSRRRGPPNRHAEAIKRRRMEEAAAAASGGSPSMSAVSISSPSSPTHAARALAALSSHTSNPHLSAESICPLELIDGLIDDFFTYIHPLCPFPHEPTFRDAWKRREDLSNSSFLALLSSMIAALVAAFPRKPRQRLNGMRKANLFPNHMSLINRCQKVCAAARGPGYLESDNLSVHDAATSYFLALVGTYTYRWRQGRLYFGECLTIVRTLGHHKIKPQAYNQWRGRDAPGLAYGSHDSEDEPPTDCITREIGRRIFWALFVGVKWCSQLGTEFNELIMPPSTPSDPYPPFPAEVDDSYIYPTHIEPQPEGLLSTITGFNANVRVFASYNSMTTMEMAWGINSVVDWDRQRRVLHESLRRCKDAVAELPPQLFINPNQQPMPGVFPHFSASADSGMDASSSMDIDQTHEQRRQMQCEIQKANIYASCLATRSYIVQKYWNLCEARDRSRSASRQNSPGTGITQAGLDKILPQAPTSEYDIIEHEMKQERESIMRDLLTVLSTIKEVHMEPSADTFTMKVRSIAGTLLDAPDERKGQLASEAREYLGVFLKILIRLERVSPATSEEQPEDEESDLRSWADLREYQAKFAQQGGVLGLS